MRVDDEDLALVGAVLEQRWRIRGLIGAGGLGVVYEVEGMDGSGPYAAKLLRREFWEEPEVVARFLAECQASARIEHPGLPRVFAASRAEDGTPYLVMERLVGEPLSALMNRGRLPADRAAQIVEQLLDTLAAAHAAGVVHRDLKPDNVFLAIAPAGAPSAAKILDFGLARVLDAAGGPARKTRTGMLLGTPGYMSPEQVKNAKDAGVPADLWAVGIILFETLTGMRAFAANNEFERMTKVLIESPTPIERVAPHYAHWAPFFQRALAREPAERFQSAVEMREALLQVARQGSMPPSTLFTTQRSKPAVLPGVGMPAILTQSSGGVFGSVDTAVSAGERAAPVLEPAVQVVQLPARGHPTWLLLVGMLGAMVVGLVLGYIVFS